MDCELSSDDRETDANARMKIEYKVLRWGGMEAERLEKILNDLGAESYAIVYMNENRIVLTRLADASRQEIPHERREAMISRLLMSLFSRCELCGSPMRRRDYMEIRVGHRRLFIGHASCFSQLPEDRQRGFFEEWGAIA